MTATCCPDCCTAYLPGVHCPSHCDPSQTSTEVDAPPEERAPEVSAQQVPAPTDLATSTPDPAVDVAGTTP